MRKSIGPFCIVPGRGKINRRLKRCCLMGYDEERIGAETGAVLEQYLSLWATDAEKARELIVKAYCAYPSDYRIMHHYMWNLAGDMADNDREFVKSFFTGVTIVKKLC